jgi:hypothetical protein
MMQRLVICVMVMGTGVAICVYYEVVIHAIQLQQRYHDYYYYHYVIVQVLVMILLRVDHVYFQSRLRCWLHYHSHFHRSQNRYHVHVDHDDDDGYATMKMMTKMTMRMTKKLMPIVMMNVSLAVICDHDAPLYHYAMRYLQQSHRLQLLLNYQHVVASCVAIEDQHYYRAGRHYHHLIMVASLQHDCDHVYDHVIDCYHHPRTRRMNQIPQIHQIDHMIPYLVQY